MGGGPIYFRDREGGVTKLGLDSMPEFCYQLWWLRLTSPDDERSHNSHSRPLAIELPTAYGLHTVLTVMGCGGMDHESAGAGPSSLVRLLSCAGLQDGNRWQLNRTTVPLVILPLRTR